MFGIRLPNLIAFLVPSLSSKMRATERKPDVQVRKPYSHETNQITMNLVFINTKYCLENKRETIFRSRANRITPLCRFASLFGQDVTSQDVTS